MNSFIVQTSLFIGIIPALVLLYIGLKGYDGYFKDKLIFLTFIVGIIIGTITVAIEYFTRTVGVFYILLFPILEQLFKTIVLNLGRFQEKQETTIYGLSLGLGFGSVFVPASIMGLESLDLTFLAAIIGSLGLLLFHAGTGVLIGYGVYSKKLPKYLTITILLHLVITTLTLITTLTQSSYLQIIFILYGILVFWYAITKIMPRILNEAQRRKRTQKHIEIKSK